MSEEQRANGAEDQPQIKVTDRRRFTPEGEPIVRGEPQGDEQVDAPIEGAAEPQPAPEAPPPPDPRDTTIAQQQVRIDELLRVLAANAEETKAARVRLEREKARVLEAERAQIAQALLEAVDALELALAAAGDATGPLVEGVRLTVAFLAKRVAELGAERFSLVGQRFDPRLAEAIDLVPVGDPNEDEVVVQEVRAGYRIGDRVLRPARVRVGRLARA